MKYFRAYPWGLQLLLFLLMIFTMAGFSGVMVFSFLPKFTPYNISQIETITEQSPRLLVNTALVVQGLFNFFMFGVSALLFAYLAHPRPAHYLGLRPAGNKWQWLLVVLLMIGIMPVLDYLEGLVSLINFGSKIKASQAANEQMMQALLNMPDVASFIRTFIVLAIVPAFSEELLFRGVFMRFVKKRTPGMAFPIIFSAFVFAYIHANVYGFVSIAIAGILLATIYYLTGSLWCSMIGHLVFNGSQIFLAFISTSNAGAKSAAGNDSVPLGYVVAGLLVAAAAFYLLLKNKTPLSDDWTNDFDPDGPSEGDWDFMVQNKG